MDIKRIFKKDYIIGLDIGTSSIKMSQFVEREDGLHLIKTGLEEISPIADAASYENEATLILKNLLKGVDINRSKIIVSINCPKTAITRVIVPYMPRSELADGIRLEAKSYFPFSIEDSFLDFEILGDLVEKGVRKYEVIVAVSPKKTVENYLSLLRKAGIKPSSFVPFTYVFQKLAERFNFEKDQVHYFLIIGRFNSELIVLKGDNLAFSRKIPVAGNDFTKALTGVLASGRGKIELSMEEAEKIKREIGIPHEGESKIIDDKISTTQILSMLRAPLEQLVSEVERCFDYYREEGGGGKADSLILFGGGASLDGVIEFLSKELEIEVKLGDILEGLKFDAGSVADRGKVSYRLGLAIGAALTEGQGINLLPPEIKEGTKRVIKRGTLEGAATAIILILALTYIGVRIQLNNFQKRISIARLELSSLGPELKQVAIFGLLAKEPYWDDVFKELSNLVPSNIYLTGLSMENNLIRMRGIINSPEPESSLSNFILILEKGLFKNVKLITTKEITGKTTNEFEITCWIDEK